MTVLPEPKPTATAAGQAMPTDADRDRIRRLMAAVDEIGTQQPTAVRVEDPNIPSHKDGPRIGDTPPVAQPGRPPMTQRAVDLNTTIWSVGAASLPVGGMTALVLHVLGTVDPTQLALGAAVPVALAVPILAVARLVRRAGEAAPPVHNHNYIGPVDQRTVHTKTSGVWAKTNNKP